MPNRFIKTCRNELDLYNCGFDHDYADSMVRSQWQARSRNNMYLLYRWLVAIFVLIIVLYSFVDNAIKRDIGTFFIYFTHWGIMINMVVGVMGAILVTIWHFHDDFKGNFFDFFADKYTKQHIFLLETNRSRRPVACPVLTFISFHLQKEYFYKIMKCQPCFESIGHCITPH